MRVNTAISSENYREDIGATIKKIRSEKNE